MKRGEKGDTYSRFSSPPPPASACRRRKTLPWQLESSVSLPLRGSASPHPPTPRKSLIFIVPPLQHPRSSPPLRDLLASQSLLLSAQVCVPKCQPPLCWLSLRYPAPGWAGTRPSAQQLMPSYIPAFPSVETVTSLHKTCQMLVSLVQ